jgi:hypothetical protein
MKINIEYGLGFVKHNDVQVYQVNGIDFTPSSHVAISYFLPNGDLKMAELPTEGYLIYNEHGND